MKFPHAKVDPLELKKDKEMEEAYAKHRERRPTIKDELTQYGNRCDWLKDEKFLKDLEGDSVDTEILDEELRSLQEDEPKTCRGNTVKFLESNPFQIVLCVLVLIDAGVVIAQILLDLHAIRGQYEEVSDSLNAVVGFVKEAHADVLGGYHGSDPDHILYLLRGSDYLNGSETPAYEKDTSHHKRRKRHIAAASSSLMWTRAQMHVYDNLAAALREATEHHESLPSDHKRPLGGQPHLRHHSGGEDSYLKTTLQLIQDNIRLRSDIAKLYAGIHVDSFSHDRARRDVPPSEEYVTNDDDGMASGSASIQEWQNEVIPASLKDNSLDQVAVVVTNASGYNYTVYLTDKEKHSSSEKLLKIAHYLHYCSIGILGIFVIQLFFKLFGMGLEFFKKKMEIFDGAIILASFALDLVFVEGIGGAQGEEAAALLILFLLWRILRVINGIMVTAKKRQEFRIKLQKRARRRAEKKIETMEDEQRLKDKEIQALKDLCVSAGVGEQEITACKPRRRVVQRLDTSMGLTSVASLSLSLSMSMSGGGGFNNIARNNPLLKSKESMQEILTPGRSRKVAMLQNNVKGDRSPTNRLTAVVRKPMARVPEESTSDGTLGKATFKHKPKSTLGNHVTPQTPIVIIRDTDKDAREGQIPKRRSFETFEVENEVKRAADLRKAASAEAVFPHQGTSSSPGISNGPVMPERRLSSPDIVPAPLIALIQPNGETVRLESRSQSGGDLRKEEDRRGTEEKKSSMEMETTRL